MSHATAAELPTIIIDTREQRPYSFDGLKVRRAKLPAGDYSIAGAELQFAVERKSMDDWVRTIIYEQARFRAELIKLAAYDRAYIVIEAGFPEILAGLYRSRVDPHAVLAITVALLHNYEIPIVTAGDRPSAVAFTRQICLQYARRHNLASGGAACTI